MTSQILDVTSSNTEISSAVALLLCLVYVVYQRFLHPLSGFPGPLAASLTNIWKAYYVYDLTLHEKLIDLHRSYGPVVRVGPNDLHFWTADSIAPIYKAGRSMGKTEFYDAFTAFRPNLFGGRDEEEHAQRRRQLSHGFSQASISKMEPIIDGQMSIFLDKLHMLANTGETFDLKQLISCYVLDILGDVAFSQSFGAQARGNAEELTAINDHLLLSSVIGQLPFQSLSKALVAWSPILWIRRLMKSRNRLKQRCAVCVRNRINHASSRQDLLQHLVNAKDPKTCSQLTEAQINSEAFAMLVAGSHSTSGTITLLLWHLLHHPEILARVESEIVQTLPPLAQDQISYPIKGLELSLPYTMACVRENFRINPVFTMCLWRRIHRKEGAQIGAYHVPHGAGVSISNYALHHNPQIWGDDHNIFNPGRWTKTYSDSVSQSLIPFSVGHRMCIGRNLAMTNILKTVTTLLSEFNFQPLSEQSTVRLRSSGIGEMEGTFMCKVSTKSRTL